MKFSIEEILKDDKHRRNVQDSVRYISDSESSRSGSPDSTGSACSDDVMYDINDTNQSRRARTAISNWQRHQLEIMFENQRYPSGDKVEKMSVQLGLPQYVIKVWFQNRRAKFRKEGFRRARASRQMDLNKPYSEPNHQPSLNPAVLGLMQLATQPIHRPPASEMPPRPSHGYAPSSCSCCSPNQFSKQQMNDIRSQNCIKPNMVSAVPTHKLSKKSLRDELCCCVECRAGTFYAQY